MSKALGFCMLRDHATEADYYLYGIELGILDFEKAIECADRIIELEAEPEVEVIDVALAAPEGRNGVMDALKVLKGARESQMAGRMLLRDLNSLLQKGSNLRAISSKALNVSWVTQMPEEIRWKFDHIDDDISLAEQGIYYDIEQCRIELKEMLELYQYHEAT